MGRQNIGNILQTVNTIFALELYFQILSNQLLLSTVGAFSHEGIYWNKSSI